MIYWLYYGDRIVGSALLPVGKCLLDIKNYVLERIDILALCEVDITPGDLRRMVCHSHWYKNDFKRSTMLIPGEK